jgi:hypothetical protein
VAEVRGLVVVMLCAMIATDAIADEDRHVVYADLLGKGGLYGIAYELVLSQRLAAGAAVSLYGADGQTVASLSPYLAWYPARGERHGWFVHAGPQLVHVATRSPVPEWEGDRATGLGLEVSSGYEYRRAALFRIYGMAAAGRGGIAPWLGTSIGWSF